MNKKRSSNEIDDYCPICLDVIQDKNISITPCGHKFCMKCLAMETFIKDRCPLCRTSFELNFKKKKTETYVIRDIVCTELHLFPYIQMQKDIMQVMNIEWSNIPNSKKGLINAKVREYMTGYGINVATTVNNTE